MHLPWLRWSRRGHHREEDNLKKSADAEDDAFESHVTTKKTDLQPTNNWADGTSEEDSRQHVTDALRRRTQHLGPDTTLCEVQLQQGSTGEDRLHQFASFMVVKPQRSSMPC